MFFCIGKGVWDGVGGIVKNKLSVAIVKCRKPIKTPQECFAYIKEQMGSDEWARLHEGKSIIEFVPFYAEDGKIDRSMAHHTYDRISGIRTMRQFLRVAPGVIMGREFACWCPACWTVMGRGVGAMDTNGRVEGCEGAACKGWADAYTWQEREVHSRQPSVRQRDKQKAQDKWRERFAPPPSPPND